MADRIQTFTTRIFLNAKQAQDELQKLNKRVEDLKKKKEEAQTDTADIFHGSW